MPSPVDRYQFTDPDVQKNPIDYFTAIRQHGPVYREPTTGIYLVSKVDEIRWVLERPDIFSNVIDPSVFRACSGGKILEDKEPEIAAIFRERGWLVPFTLLFNDPPEHGYYRSLANQALSPANIKKLIPFIQDQTDRLIAAFPESGDVEFVAEFAVKLPISVIALFLGAPEEDWPKIRSWSEQTFSTLFGQASQQEYLKTVDAIIEMQHYVAGKIEDQKKTPTPNLLRTLMTAHDELKCDPLSTEEILSIFHVLLVAAHDTTSQTLTNCLRVLAEQPELADRLRREPAKLNDFVNEVLRFYHPAGVSARFVKQDVELGGVHIPKGATVYALLSSGSRDEDKFQCPHQFDMDRTEKENLGFGYGIHFCVGFRLAKTVLSIALKTLLERFQSIELTVPREELTYLPVINQSSLVRLPLHFK